LWGIVKFKLYKNYITIVNIFGGVYIYDVIVIGTGAGGATVAKDLSQYGKDVLILEKGSRKRQGSYVQHMKTKKIHLKKSLPKPSQVNCDRFFDWLYRLFKYNSILFELEGTES
jgi:UDP-galactopyranose mutase